MKKNPIITGEMMPFSCRGVYNSTAIKDNGKYYMILRAQAYSLYSFLWLAESDDGYEWEIKNRISLPKHDDLDNKVRLYYDPRITKIGDTYFLTICIALFQPNVPSMGLLVSKDLENFEWKGFISPPNFRNTVFFPEKINGLFTVLKDRWKQGIYGYHSRQIWNIGARGDILFHLIRQRPVNGLGLK